MIAKFLAGLIAVAVAYAGWQLGAVLNSDGVALLLGFGLCLVAVGVPMVVLALYGRQRRIVVQSHAHAQKTLPQPTTLPTQAITSVPAQTWRVLDPSTALALRESEVTAYGN